MKFDEYGSEDSDEEKRVNNLRQIDNETLACDYITFDNYLFQVNKKIVKIETKDEDDRFALMINIVLLKD